MENDASSSRLWRRGGGLSARRPCATTGVSRPRLSCRTFALDLCGEHCCHSSRTEAGQGTSRARTSPLSIAGQMVTTIGCLLWRPIW